MRIITAAGLVVLLAGCGGRSTAEWAEQLNDADASRRLEAVRQLQQRGTEAEEVVPALARALKDENAFVRRDAASALGKLGAEAQPAVPALLALRRDRERSVRKAVASALREIDPAAAARVDGR
jgi:HEAT repeat protein